MAITIRDHKRTWGVVQDGIFLMRFRKSDNWLEPYGWAIPTCVVDDAREAGACTIQIFDADNGDTWTCEIQTIAEEGFQTPLETTSVLHTFLLPTCWNVSTPEGW